MDQDGDPPKSDDSLYKITSLSVLVLSVAALAFCGAMGWRLASLGMQMLVISLVIWQACDPFADAAQWIGVTFRLPGSVRGATLDAVASSMPELFSGIFFVLVPVMAFQGDGIELLEIGGQGFGSTLATCAGSAIYNMILIPAFCAIFISYYRKSRPTIDVEPEVISRDGMWFLVMQAVLLVFLYRDAMEWWSAFIFLGLYGVYVYQLYCDARQYQKAQTAIRRHLDEIDAKSSTGQIIDTLESEGIKTSPSLVDQIRHELLDAAGGEERETETAGFLFGVFHVRLNHVSVWWIIGISTIVVAAACYWLVEATNQIAVELNIAPFFVAVILAAAASSVPDTFLSVMAAKRGDDSGAVSNAFGSTIFNIGVGLAIPLLVNSYLVNWNTVYLTENGRADGEELHGLFGLRIMLWVLTIITLLILWHNRQLTRRKAWVLCGLYGVFMAYVIIDAIYDLSRLWSVWIGA